MMRPISVINSLITFIVVHGLNDYRITNSTFLSFLEGLSDSIIQTQNENTADIVDHKTFRSAGHYRDNAVFVNYETSWSTLTNRIIRNDYRCLTDLGKWNPTEKEHQMISNTVCVLLYGLNLNYDKCSIITNQANITQRLQLSYNNIKWLDADEVSELIWSLTNVIVGDEFGNWNEVDDSVLYMDPYFGMRFIVSYMNDRPSIASSLLKLNGSVIKPIRLTQMIDMAVITLIMGLPSPHPVISFISFTVKELLGHKTRDQKNPIAGARILNNDERWNYILNKRMKTQ
jgi:hypothetical protein